MKRALCLLVLSAFLVLLPRGFADPRDGWSLESRVPATSLALLGIEDVGGMAARFERTAIAGLFREPEMKAFAEPIGKAVMEMVRSEEGSPLGPATPMIARLLEQLAGLRGQVALALVDMDMDRGQPHLAASLDFGPHVGDFATFLERMRKEMDPDGQAITSFDKDGRTWWQHRGDGPPIAATTVDTAFVLATDAGLLERVIAGTGEPMLAASADFQGVRRRAGGSELGMFVYANVPAIVDRLAPMMGEDGARIATALGLDTIKAAAYGMAFSGDGFMDSFIVHAPGADHGLLRLMEMPPYQPRALAWAPANTFYFEEGAIDVAALLPNVRELMAGIDPSMTEQMDGMLGQVNAMLGVDVEKEVLGGLAGGLATYVAMPDTGGLFPEVAIMMQAKDPAAFEGVMERLARGVAGAVTEEGDVVASTRTLEYRGQRLHLMELQAARGDDVVPFTPTWTLLGDWCVITLVPHAMKEIVLRAQAGGASAGLAAQEDFRSLREAMPKPAGEITYVDLQAAMNLLYDTAVPLLQTAVKPNLLGRQVPFPLDWAQLPAARTVRPYFRSLGVFTTWNRDGMAVQMHGPLPMVGLFAMAAGAGAAMFLGGVRRAESIQVPYGAGGRMPEPPEVPEDAGSSTSAKARQASMQAMQLTSYVRIFVLTEDRMPASLDELVEKEVIGSVSNDPWGHPFQLRVLDEKARRFVVVSAGEDGEFDTADDVKAGG
jgi:hypothetical protein